MSPLLQCGQLTDRIGPKTMDSYVLFPLETPGYETSPLTIYNKESKGHSFHSTHAKHVKMLATHLVLPFHRLAEMVVRDFQADNLTFK